MYLVETELTDGRREASEEAPGDSTMMGGEDSNDMHRLDSLSEGEISSGVEQGLGQGLNLDNLLEEAAPSAGFSFQP